MAKGENVSWTLEGYAPGVENHENFLGVCFRKNVAHLVTTKEKNAERGFGIKETSKLFNLKPLGAAAPASKKVDKVYMGILWSAADKQTKKKGGSHFGKSDAEMAPLLLTIYKTKNPAHEVTEVDFLNMRSGIDAAEDLLAQV
jgi:hypothetical protein